MNRKFKPWWSPISSISTEWIITSHLKSLNIKKICDIWCWKSRPWLETGTNCGRIEQVNGILTLPLDNWISNGNADINKRWKTSTDLQVTINYVFPVKKKRVISLRTYYDWCNTHLLISFSGCSEAIDWHSITDFTTHGTYWSTISHCNHIESNNFVNVQK
jgi:hypothetical protein